MPSRASLPTSRTLRPSLDGRSPSGVASTRPTSLHAELTAQAMLPPHSSSRTRTKAPKVRNGLRRRGLGAPWRGRPSGPPGPPGRRGPPSRGGAGRRGVAACSGAGREGGVPAGMTRVRGSSVVRRGGVVRGPVAAGRVGIGRAAPDGSRGRRAAPEPPIADEAAARSPDDGRRGRSLLPVGIARASSRPRRPLRMSKVIASSSRPSSGRRGLVGRSGMPRRIGAKAGRSQDDDGASAGRPP